MMTGAASSLGTASARVDVGSLVEEGEASIGDDDGAVDAAVGLSIEMGVMLATVVVGA